MDRLLSGDTARWAGQWLLDTGLLDYFQVALKLEATDPEDWNALMMHRSCHTTPQPERQDSTDRVRRVEIMTDGHVTTKYICTSFMFLVE